MADVFISYSRDDAAFVQELVAILQSSGVSVWWDRDLVGGSEFHRVIEQQINDAGKVIVVWSARSVDSTWVMDEANAARDLKKIVPLVIDDCMPPMGHRSLHTLRSRSADAIKAQILTAVGVTRQPEQPTEPKVKRTNPQPSSPTEPSPPDNSEKTTSQSERPDVASMSDIFEDLFGKHMGAKDKGANDQSTKRERGSDLRYNLEITLAEAYSGKVSKINVPKDSGGQQRQLSVNIPAGVEDGTRIRLAGEGEAGLGGGFAGDLYIFLSIAPHEFFQRDGADIFCRVPIAMTMAALGGQVELPTVDGSKTRVKVPAGTETGKQFRLKGKGMPVLRSKLTGDMYIQLEVETPRHLTPRQRDILKSFEETKRPSTRPTRTGRQQNGADVTCAIRISVVTAALGRPIDVQLVDGSTARVNIVEGTQHGQQYRLRGQGHPRSDGSGRGDMFVRIETEPLSQLTQADRELLREFAQESGQATNPESHGFFSKVRDFFDSKSG